MSSNNTEPNKRNPHKKKPQPGERYYKTPKPADQPKCSLAEVVRMADAAGMSYGKYVQLLEGR